MGIKIINVELGIASCDFQTLELKDTEKETLTVFYYADRDWIVLNESSAHFELWSKLFEAYVSFDDEQKRDFIAGLDGISSTALEAIKYLNFILRIRRKRGAAV